MLQKTRKIGFWSVVAIVIGSQVGSGMFMLPAILAPYGYFGLVGWVISGGSVLCLAIVFSLLSSWFPKTGGPHAYVQNGFGPHVAFFIGWSYWLVSWVSTIVVIVACIGYLSPFLGDATATTYLTLEIILLGCITLLNLKGVYIAGKTELFLASLKFALILLLPIIAFSSFKSSNFAISTEISNMNITTILGQVALLTMWGFIGVETGTTPAGTVEKPSSTIPKALIFGTFCVAMLYLINSIGMMGLIPAEILAKTKAPYVEATQIIFGGHWSFVVSLVIFLVCVSTVNTWTLVSGQIILGLAEDKLVPQFFAKKNKYHAPSRGILTSSLGMLPILILTASTNLVKQITTIIDYSVTVFLFVYLICVLATIKIALQKRIKLNILQWFAVFISLIFCTTVIYEATSVSLMVSTLFILSGLPIYFFWYLRSRKP